MRIHTASLVSLVSVLGLVACSAPPDGEGGTGATPPTQSSPTTGAGPTTGDTGGSAECYDNCNEPSGGGGGTGTGSGPSTSTIPSAVDPACALGQATDMTEELVPKWTPLAPTVPNDCLVGYEVNRLTKDSYVVTSQAGSRAITLEVDIATYTAADHVRLVATDASGKETVLIDTCRLRTATYGDPTGGTERPPEDSIRDFRVDLPAGTRKLTLDNTGATTPTYIRVLGLCDFTMSQPASMPANRFRTLTSR